MDVVSHKVWCLFYCQLLINPGWQLFPCEKLARVHTLTEEQPLSPHKSVGEKYSIEFGPPQLFNTTPCLFHNSLSCSLYHVYNHVIFTVVWTRHAYSEFLMLNSAFYVLYRTVYMWYKRNCLFLSNSFQGLKLTPSHSLGDGKDVTWGWFELILWTQSWLWTLSWPPWFDNFCVMVSFCHSGGDSGESGTVTGWSPKIFSSPEFYMCFLNFWTFNFIYHTCFCI